MNNIVEKNINNVDFDRLKESNDLCHKWADHFNIASNYYIKFIIDLYKNINKFVVLLEQEKQIELINDHKIMFYSIEVEDILVKQFYHTVPHFIKKLKIKDSLYDHYLSVGLCAVRNAVWNYKTHESNASFFTFCCHGVFIRLSREGSKLVSAKKRKKNINMIFESDLSNEVNNFSLAQFSGAKITLDNEESEEVTKSFFESLIEESGINEDEKFLISEYMNRGVSGKNWSTKYMEMYFEKYKSTLSRQTIYNKLYAAQRKIWSVYTRKTGTPFKDTRLIFLNNSTFKA